MIASLIEQLPLLQRKKWLEEHLNETRTQLNRSFRCMAIAGSYFSDTEETRMPELYDSLKFMDEIISDLEEIEPPPSNPKKKSGNNP